MGALAVVGLEQRSPVGRIESGWEIVGDEILYRFRVPLTATALLNLPGEPEAALGPGEHAFTRPLPPEALGLDSPISAIYRSPGALEALRETLPELTRMMLFEMMAGERSVADFVREGFLKPDDPALAELERRLKAL